MCRWKRRWRMAERRDINNPNDSTKWCLTCKDELPIVNDLETWELKLLKILISILNRDTEKLSFGERGHDYLVFAYTWGGGLKTLWLCLQ